MTIPAVQPQTTIVPVTGMRLELSVAWVDRADHTVVRYELRSGLSGDLLALGVGSAPDWREPEALAHALRKAIDNLVDVTERTYINPEPF